MNEVNTVFGVLNKVLVEFKGELENKRVAFVLKEGQLNINLSGVLSEVYYPSDVGEVYKALGYDVEVICSLGQVFAKLNFKHLGDRDTRVVTNLLNGLMHIARSIQILFEDVLNESKLEMLKFRDVDDLNIITQCLVQFIEMVKNLMPRIKDGVISAASKTSAKDVVKALNGGILANQYVMLNSMLRNIHGLLFDIIAWVELDMIIV
ncbi:hypothetical protein A7978_04540 (plasmid) [Borrelia turicatae]|nr:hypothetical protein [Borrelia turicatae]ANF34382.1 hypothetical protein A7978_04540 [Borrelia turicatae]UPA13966.1 hypothetical protein bt91E135_001128 [Borrelia turicatae 91E135]UPA15459.1 hypothetical protein btBTE5EL_001139 [Borrelia turicatae]